MLNWIDYVNFAIDIAGLTISLVGIAAIMRIQYLNRITTRYFYALFVVFSLYIISDLTSHLSFHILGPGYDLVSQLAVFFMSLFASILLPIITLFILRLSKESFNSLFLYLVAALWTFYILLLIYAQFSTRFYYIGVDNSFQRGKYYPVLFVPAFLILITDLVALLRRSTTLPQKPLNILYSFIIIPMISMVIQMVSTGIHVIVLGCSVSCLILLFYIINEGADKYIEQKFLISEQEFRARSLQMRPHFIYNTLSNIYYLCELDPMKAQKVIDDFTTYLKKNFSAITTQGLVPFEEELEHTKAYLAVVKSRYEDLLFVEFDTNHKAFKLPPLTLEPLVENAVKHALDPDSDPLYILIRTRKENGFNIITVENNGIDFPSEEALNFSKIEDNNEPHIGINNVKNRLKAYCNGTLKVTKRPGGGAIATIRIPTESPNSIITGRLITE